MLKKSTVALLCATVASALLSSDATEDIGGDGSSCGCGGDALSRSHYIPPQDAEMGDDAGAKRDAKAVDESSCNEGCEDEHTAAMVELEGGNFQMGSDAGFFPEDEEGPSRKIRVSGFKIGKHEVSNERFAAFVAATGYVTEAERFGNSFVVEQFVSKEVSKEIESAVAAAPWWIPVNHSNWRHPEGIDSNWTSRGYDRSSHPVVHVSWNDAVAFCKWSVKGGRLPTEAEWEFAAGAGQRNKRFPWGDKMFRKDKTGKSRHRMNTWQSAIEERFLKDRNVFHHSYLPTHDGHVFFSSENAAEDGWELTAPVDEYKPNKFGLYNTVGNVWEWINDWQGPRDPAKVDPQGPPTGTNKVKKGGSFMCHQFTCYRYRVAARMFITPDSSASNVGFRCAA